MAIDRGITEQELIEFLNVAITMQGCPGEEWALKTFTAYKQHTSGAPVVEQESCCT